MSCDYKKDCLLKLGEGGAYRSSILIFWIHGMLQNVSLYVKFCFFWKKLPKSKSQKAPLPTYSFAMFYLWWSCGFRNFLFIMVLFRSVKHIWGDLYDTLGQWFMLGFWLSSCPVHYQRADVRCGPNVDDSGRDHGVSRILELLYSKNRHSRLSGQRDATDWGVADGPARHIQGSRGAQVFLFLFFVFFCFLFFFSIVASAVC